jgi:hypothetical protein
MPSTKERLIKKQSTKAAIVVVTKTFVSSENTLFKEKVIKANEIINKTTFLRPKA